MLREGLTRLRGGLQELQGLHRPIPAPARRAPARARAGARRPGPGGAEGMALLEVLIGSVLVALAAVGVALMFSSGQASIHSDGDNRIALFLGTQRIEAIRAQGYTGSMAAFGTVVETSATAGSTLVDHPGYRRTTVVTDQCPFYFTILRSAGGCSPPPATDEAKLITVTVEPMEGASTTVTDRMARSVTVQAVLVKTQ